MRLLLDSHVVVWWWVQPELLSQAAREAIVAANNEVYVSAVTAYELLSKRHRDPVLQQLPASIETTVNEERWSWLSVTPGDAEAAASLPRLHGDPWDRILIAQSASIGAHLVTADRQIGAYSTAILW